MHRAFQRHLKRDERSLDGFWDIIFSPADDNEDFSRDFPIDRSERIWVPSCWNFLSQRYYYHDVAWYHKIFETADVGNIMLKFSAASGLKHFWLDGVYLGEHYGSFTEIDFIAKSVSAGKHELIVKVDNRHNELTLPKTLVDWFLWGGLYRPVTCSHLEDCLIRRVFIDPIWNGYELDEVNIRIRVENLTDSLHGEEVHIEFEGSALGSNKVDIQPGVNDIDLGRFDIGDVELWDINNPSLYTFKFTCGSDDLIERTGFRKLETSSKKILLNGKPLKIKGFNRHHCHGSHGFAIAKDITVRDFEIIKGIGANGVRGSHYPNDPVVMDVCDEKGIVFMEEMPFWGHLADSLGNELFRNRVLTMLRETIERDYNHPSIIFWSLQNESGTDCDEGVKLFTQMAELVRELDSNRLITYATNIPEKDRCYDLIDVIGVNRYMGWYECPVESWPERIADLKAHLASVGQEDKPLMITEFGACGFLGDVSLERDRKYSEEFQEDYLEYVLNYLMGDDDIAGMYIWQFSDTRTTERLTNEGRPRGFNTKGIVDEYRRPKTACEIVRKIYSSVEQT